jgi:predicted dehydrogenase/threonine dehydrogenase-like Zn-dependent dehydrogenase
VKQIAQNKRTGDLAVVSVPPPAGRPGMIVVKNYFSVISAGTEKTSIDSRKGSLLQRARSQPDEMRKVIDEARRTGLYTTWKRIMSKLDTSAALGYSCAGVVVAVDPSIQDIEIGDRVACAGAEFAVHSDLVVAPRNLVAPIPDGVSMEAAAYTTIAAIAMQGVRQAEITLGETVVVIGLGLLGQFTVQILKAAGCRVVGIDLDRAVIDLAVRSGADAALHRLDDPVASVVASLTRGYGADATIITAGTKQNDPIELAGVLTRERGRVVMVGAAPMDIPRGPYYMKEIDIRMSRSYGPGRYNADYELKGLDYPIGYVRWTENRNMQAYLDLLAQGRIDTGLLTTHRFHIDDALSAYALIEGEKTEPYVGILLTYDDLAPDELAVASQAASIDNTIRISPKRSSLTVGFIGAGSFASGYLLPHLKSMDDVTLGTVCNRTGLTATDMRNKFGFAASTTTPDEILTSDTIGTVFIATRHGDHAALSAAALRNGQHVFVEKPMALGDDDLATLSALLEQSHAQNGRQTFMVGFNRRFAPLVTAMRDFFASTREPSIIHYYVNAGFLPADHWTHDPVDGGGRIVGEVCHFIDTIQFLTGGALPVRLHAEHIATDNTAVTPHDNVAITMRMSDGSIGVITYVSNGDTSVPKERIVMSAGLSTAIMDNFTTLDLYRGGKKSTKKSAGDKGHRNEVIAFMDAIRAHRAEVIPFDSMIATTRATFRILDSLVQKQAVTL